jgi:hypothetical protein
MVEKYHQRYGVPGVVLYPSRASDTPQCLRPPERLGRATETFTCAFAGTINTPGTVDALNVLAESLRLLGGRLLMFGRLDHAQVKASGLTAANIQLRGHSVDLISALRECADTLFVPMSFSETDRANMEISFPSKLADYTAAGLPLLIYGPGYCSAVRWARQNPGVAEVVSERTGKDLAGALGRLNADCVYRLKLGETALATGSRYFSHKAACEMLHAHLDTGMALRDNAMVTNGDG